MFVFYTGTCVTSGLRVFFVNVLTLNYVMKTFLCLLWKTQEIHIILQIVKTLEMLHCYSLLKKEQQKLIKQIHVSVFFLNALN